MSKRIGVKYFALIMVLLLISMPVYVYAAEGNSTISGNNLDPEDENEIIDGDSIEIDGESEENDGTEGDGEPEESDGTEGDGEPEESDGMEGDGEPEESDGTEGDGKPEEGDETEGDGKPVEGDEDLMDDNSSVSENSTEPKSVSENSIEPSTVSENSTEPTTVSENSVEPEKKDIPIVMSSDIKLAMFPSPVYTAGNIQSQDIVLINRGEEPGVIMIDQLECLVQGDKKCSLSVEIREYGRETRTINLTEDEGHMPLQIALAQAVDTTDAENLLHQAAEWNPIGDVKSADYVVLRLYGAIEGEEWADADVKVSMVYRFE